jgi:hypothetical protein
MGTYINAEDLLDHLTGAGACQYGWYLDLSGEGNRITVEMEDPNDSQETVRKSVSVTEARKVIASIIKEQKPGWQYVSSAMERDDFDANDADIVLQYIALGELVYG